MYPFDVVLTRARRAILVGAAALFLTLTPSLSSLAAPAPPPPATRAAHQDDDTEQVIVPVGSDQPNADAGNTNDVAANGDPAADDQSSDDRGEVLTTPGIISPAADLQPNQWAGVLDGRLVAPFAISAQPVRITASAIGLDSEVTPREIVGGEMQTPKDENEVSWYKETAAPGEAGNAVFAGHLNWYGVPQAVFYAIDQLKKGDEITVTDDQGHTFVYRVQWVKLVDVANADMHKIVGSTKKPSLTLITCGGEWNASASEYNQRTVVRAVLVRQES